MWYAPGFFFLSKHCTGLILVENGLKKKLDVELAVRDAKKKKKKSRSAYCYVASEVSSDHFFAVFLCSEMDRRSICTTERLGVRPFQDGGASYGLRPAAARRLPDQGGLEGRLLRCRNSGGSPRSPAVPVKGGGGGQLFEFQCCHSASHRPRESLRKSSGRWSQLYGRWESVW